MNACDEHHGESSDSHADGVSRGERVLSHCELSVSTQDADVNRYNVEGACLRLAGVARCDSDCVRDVRVTCLLHDRRSY